LYRGDRAALAVLDSAVAHAPAVPTQHRVDEDAADCAEQLVVVRKPRAQLERQRDDELAQRRVGQHVIDEIRRSGCHASAQERGTKSASFARKAHDPPLLAIAASEHRKASREHAAVDEPLELFADEAG
jgi:hypothetical protein